MHAQELSHGNICPGNIILHEVEGELCAYLVNFGLTRMCTASELDERPDYQAKQTTFGNSQEYWPPEVYLIEDLTQIDRKKADIWALGMVLCDLFIQEPQDGFRSQIKDKINAAIAELAKDAQPCDYTPFIAQFLEDVGKEQSDGSSDSGFKWDQVVVIDTRLASLKKLIQRMLKVDPNERCDMEDVFETSNQIWVDSSIDHHDESLLEEVVYDHDESLAEEEALEEAVE